MRAFNVFLSAVFAILLVPAERALAETHTDPIFGFKITTPDTWQSLQMDDGTDRVLQMQSPDGNAFGEVRAVHLSRDVSLESLREAFISTISPEAILVGSQAETLSGLPGEVSAWTADMDGQQVIIGGFFAIDGPVGYVLWTVTARQNYDAYSDDFDKIFDTFLPGYVIGTYAGETAPPVVDTIPPAQTSNFDQAELFKNLVAEPHPELGFVFVRYDAWHPDQPAPYALRVGLMEYPPEMRPSIVIEALAGEAYASLQAGIADLKSQLMDAPGVQFDQDGPHQIENMSENGQLMDGWSFGASYLHGDVPFRQLTFLFKRKDPSVFYAIYVTGPQEILMQHQPEMLRMLQAIQIVPFQ
ncbi:hypothetical protein [Falsiruegeria mediterranea]|uniref:DUF1795 domain-containing protein n=1 Tax=Falsiruegeria mediterranea M17 TaxID=1200281 RepID=A0A2R8CGJ1_9RHOB|nr:hypothetical protein [Falsiruegeria mediterranea]SPJ31516.1 hypothetical protein TRM7615_05059 [Falsiruegeria mediterranea M17]